MRAILLSLLFVSPCFAREWSDSSGRFSVDADLVEYDAKRVKLKRKDNAKLITVERRKLSKADRDYLAAKQNVDSSRKFKESTLLMIQERVEHRRSMTDVQYNVFASNLLEQHKEQNSHPIVFFEAVEQFARTGKNKYRLQYEGGDVILDFPKYSDIAPTDVNLGDVLAIETSFEKEDKDPQLRHDYANSYVFQPYVKRIRRPTEHEFRLLKTQ